jgi:hypothetical protein
MIRSQHVNSSRKSRVRSRKPSRRRLNPHLELLEGRVVLSTLVVTSASDSGTGSLRAAIAAAQSGDTIQFAKSLKGQTIHLSSGELAIGQSLTIQGPGAGKLDVDAGGLSRVFDVTSASAAVTISGLTISGGSAVQGGGLLDQGGTLTLSGDAIANNQAVGDTPDDPGQGGGVAVLEGGSLTASNTTFLNNLAQGAVGSAGAGGSYLGQGGAGQGGAIYEDGTGVNVSGGSFQNNQAIGGNGAAQSGSYFWAYNGFGGTGSGGGIYLNSGALTVTGSSFTGNLAQGGRGGDGGNSYENGFGGDGQGGAVFAAGTSVNLSSDTFQSNRAVGGQAGQGGAGAGYNYGTSSSSALYAYNDFGGSATGGGLYLSSGALTVADSTFEENAVVGGDGSQAAGTPYSRNGDGGGGSGGAVQISSSDEVSFTDGTFRDNSAAGGQGVGGGSAGGGNAGAIGGGSDGVPMTVSGCLFDANQVQSSPNGYGAWGAAIDSPSTLDILDSKFTNNDATGGFIWGGVVSAFDVLTVQDSTFTGNTATGDAVDGGVLLAGGLLTVDGTTFSNNQAIGIRGTDGQNFYLGAGGVVGGGVINAYVFTITDSTFTSNQALAGDGGNGAPGSSGSPGGDIVGGVIGTTLLYPFGWGQAILESSTPNMIIDGCRFTNNVAIAGSGGAGGAGANGGAGGSVRGGDVSIPRQGSITNSSFTSSGAIGGNGGQGGEGGGNGGAGGDVFGGSVGIWDSWGVLSYINNPTDFIQDVKITGVTAQGGAGGAGGSGGDGGNGGDVQGGAIQLYVTLDALFADVTLDYELSITDSHIAGISAQGGNGGSGGSGGNGGDGGNAYGGALALEGYTYDYYGTATLNINATVTDTKITGNLVQGGDGGAGGSGGNGGGGGNAEGGGFFADQYSQFTLVNGSITGNQADGGAGGIGVLDGTDGTGIGGGVYLSTSGSVKTGTKIVGNSASTSDDDVYGSFS